jgi:DNA-binding NarL/FixJ family response regulator
LTIKVLVVDDHAVVRSGLGQLLSTAPDLELAGEAKDGQEAVDVAEIVAPDVILMDISMPVLDGVEATRRIMARDPGARIVMLTSLADNRQILDALEAGASGYLLKHAAPDELLGAIRAAAAGEAPLDPKAARALLDSRRAAPAAGDKHKALSAREQEVLRLVAQGLANKQIGRRLGISERTVKAHLTNVFSALGVSDRTQAALWAREHLPEPA